MNMLHPNDPQEAREFFGRKLRFTVGPWDLKTLEKQGADFAILDLRRSEDYASEHIPGALSLPEGRWPSLAGLSKTGVNVLYCYNQQCHLAARAAFQFAQAGYSVMELEGGFQAWKDAKLGVERGEWAGNEPKSA
jgi:rhodanese-related sulfurtransferase